MKKILKITGIVLLSLLLILLILPFAFKGKVAGIIQEQANKNLQAKVAFSDLSLSFFKNFPKVTASLENLTIAGVDAFEGDTLLSAKEISVAVNLTSLFSDEGISVKRIELVSPKILAKVLA
ncbi:MAG: AsmA family protein, partial [Parabacteroides sp.]|nr:AsmA family protein [Parabacteroides sp.]